MKNILFVNFQNKYGGGEIYLETIINGFSDKSEFKIFTITPNTQEFIEKIKDNSEIIIGFNRDKKFISLINLKNYLKQARLINNIIKEKKIEIVFLNAKEAIYLAPLLNKKVRKVGVNHIIGIDKPAVFFKKILTKFSIKNLDKIIVVSKKAREKLIEDVGLRYKNKIELVYNGIDIDKFRNAKEYPKGENDKFVIMEIGRLQRLKGHKELINAFSLLLKEFDDIELNIVGEGEERENIENQIKELGIEKYVKLLGFVPTEEIIKKADVVVLPSYSESFGLVLIEAMAASKVVIGSNVGGIPELIIDNENGFLVEIGEFKKIYEKIKILYANLKMRRKMGENGFRYAKERFSKDKMLRDTFRIIKGE
jgi:glycosyltransferase involved in cell wall biosynthesis